MRKYEKLFSFTHINGGNRGCEAIVRTTGMIFAPLELTYYLGTNDRVGDTALGLDKVGQLVDITRYHGIHPLHHLPARILRELGINSDYRNALKYKSCLDLVDERSIVLVTGGDLYCYPHLDHLDYINRAAKRRGAFTILWGCSVEKSLISEKVRADLQRYDLITPRESLTQQTLLDCGIDQERVRPYPDPAFLLPALPTDSLPWEKMGPTVGLNLSTYLVKTPEYYETFKQFIQYILDTTPYSVVLVPHVYWEHESDWDLLCRYRQEFAGTGRVYMPAMPLGCRETKGIIARCELYIGARTHTMIAAYSSCVPSLALGYSVKSKGIAQDLFGADLAAELAVDVRNGFTLGDLTAKFGRLMQLAPQIRVGLEAHIPQYQAQLAEETFFLQHLLGASDLTKEF